MDSEDISAINAWLIHNELTINNIESQIIQLHLEINALEDLQSALKVQRESVQDSLKGE